MFLFNDESLDVLIKNTCDNYLIKNSIQIEICNNTVAIETTVKLLFFWNNIFRLDGFQKELNKLCKTYEQEQVTNECMKYANCKSRECITFYEKNFDTNNIYYLNKRFCDYSIKINKKIFWIHMTKLLKVIKKADELYDNSSKMYPSPELWITKQSEMRKIYKTQFKNYDDKDIEYKYMKWMYDNLPENMDKHIKNYYKLNMPLDLCELYYDLMTTKTHHI